MPKVALMNISGQSVGEIELSDGIFGIEPNVPVSARSRARDSCQYAARARRAP